MLTENPSPALTSKTLRLPSVAKALADARPVIATIESGTKPGAVLIAPVAWLRSLIEQVADPTDITLKAEASLNLRLEYRRTLHARSLYGEKRSVPSRPKDTHGWFALEIDNDKDSTLWVRISIAEPQL
jgi:hypothetical protein